jgi:cell division protein FtsN
MTKDYKGRQSGPRPRQARRRSCFFWFVTGAVLGGFGVGLMWVLKQPGPPPPAGSVAKKQNNPAPKPRFDFYSILPEMEVVVPDEELKEKPASFPKPKSPPPPAQPATEPKQAQTPPAPPEEQTPPPSAPRASADGTSYLLQIASFRGRSDAERLKAKLALLGIRAQIQRVTINNKDTYHRVRAGPFKGKEALNKARELLSSNGFQSVPIRLK